MTEEERDDLLIASYIAMARIYDVLLAGLPPARRQELQKLHGEGDLLGPEPVLRGESDE